jgi:hypothetical protein
MSKEEEYQGYAAECLRMAEASLKQEYRRKWWNLAQQWTELIRRAQPNTSPADAGLRFSASRSDSRAE